MNKKEHFKLFEQYAKIGNQIQQDKLYELALALFKNGDDKLFEKLECPIRVIFGQKMSTIIIALSFPKMSITYCIYKNGAIDCASCSCKNKKMSDFESFMSIENELESYTKDLLDLVIDHEAEKSEFYRKVK